MDENTKQSKLDNRLEINPTDYAIKTFTPEFKEGQKYTKVPVKISGNATLKGLKIFFMRKSKKRYFYLSFWCHSESLTLPCGLFRDGVYGMKEVEEYLRPIVKACTNKDGHWIKDPKRWLEGEIEEIIKRKEEEDKLNKPINLIIEMICKENFPKTKIVGTLSKIQIRTNAAFLLGYNERTKHLIFAEDKNGNGLIKFKEGGPQNFDELFKVYPPGKGLIKNDPQLNPNGERSLYDSPLGLTPVLELLPGDVEDYINRKDRSFGYRTNLLDTLSHLWSFARFHKSKPLGRTPPLNPCRRRDGGITIKKERKSKYKGSYLNEMSFSPELVKKIENKLWQGVPHFGFVALALLFILYCGKRIEESLKVRTSDIDWKNEEINIRLTKTRKIEKVDFDADILKVLDKVKELKRKKFGKITSIKSLQWLFPSSRINILKLHDDEYVSSDQTRLKRLETCMAWVKKELDISGSMKTFRKAFDTNALHKAKLSAEELSAVTGQSPETINRRYNKPGKEIRKKLKERIRA